MTKAPTPEEISKGQSDNTNNATKSSITQQLCNDDKIEFRKIVTTCRLLLKKTTIAVQVFHGDLRIYDIFTDCRSVALIFVCVILFFD